MEWVNGSLWALIYLFSLQPSKYNHHLKILLEQRTAFPTHPKEQTIFFCENEENQTIHFLHEAHYACWSPMRACHGRVCTECRCVTAPTTVQTTSGVSLHTSLCACWGHRHQRISVPLLVNIVQSVTEFFEERKSRGGEEEPKIHSSFCLLSWRDRFLNAPLSEQMV